VFIYERDDVSGEPPVNRFGESRPTSSYRSVRAGRAVV